jgi:hypothetical protein
LDQEEAVLVEEEHTPSQGPSVRELLGREITEEEAGLPLVVEVVAQGEQVALLQVLVAREMAVQDFLTR